MPTLIEVDWAGPYTYEEIPSDVFGIYQVYGPHPTYGQQALLYIGKTKRNFKKRLEDEAWWFGDNNGSMRYRVGTRWGNRAFTSEEIDLVEKVLIIAHAPAYNSKDVQSNWGEDAPDLVIYNWNDYGLLLPAVVADRYRASHFK